MLFKVIAGSYRLTVSYSESMAGSPTREWFINPAPGLLGGATCCFGFVCVCAYVCPFEIKISLN